MKKKYMARLLMLFLIGGWSQTLFADNIVGKYLNSNWAKVEGNIHVGRMYDERKYHHIELYRYDDTELYAAISRGVLKYSRSMRGICFSEVRISYFMAKELDEVNIQSFKLGWLFYLPRGSSILKSCNSELVNPKEVSVVGDVSFDDAIYVLQNIRKIEKNVSSKEINCEAKELLSIFSNKLNILEVDMADSKGKRFSLMLLKEGGKIRPDECFEVSN